jgi:two-component system OmpR family response regulator
MVGRQALRSDGGQMRVLLVEDEVSLARSVCRGLEAEGFAVEVVHDGREGLWRAREGTFDAIVLDIMLPGMNGYRVCSALREDGDWTPILMLTAKHGEFDEVEALDTGADDFLPKPFSFAVLTARLRALLRRGAPERPAVLSAGDLRLDPASHRCWRGKAEVTLTPKEFSILEYLLRRLGQVVSRTSVLEHVWDPGYDGESNVVDVYMAYLRKKIDSPFGRRAIETVRGVGYRLRPDGG